MGNLDRNRLLAQLKDTADSGAVVVVAVSDSEQVACLRG